MSVAAIGIEVAKALFVLTLQELQRAGMSAAEAKAYLEAQRTEFYKNNPDNIPDPK